MPFIRGILPGHKELELKTFCKFDTRFATYTALAPSPAAFKTMTSVYATILSSSMTRV